MRAAMLSCALCCSGPTSANDLVPALDEPPDDHQVAAGRCVAGEPRARRPPAGQRGQDWHAADLLHLARRADPAVHRLDDGDDEQPHDEAGDGTDHAVADDTWADGVGDRRTIGERELRRTGGRECAQPGEARVEAGATRVRVDARLESCDRCPQLRADDRAVVGEVLVRGDVRRADRLASPTRVRREGEDRVCTPRADLEVVTGRAPIGTGLTERDGDALQERRRLGERHGSGRLPGRVELGAVGADRKHAEIRVGQEEAGLRLVVGLDARAVRDECPGPAQGRDEDDQEASPESEAEMLGGAHGASKEIPALRRARRAVQRAGSLPAPPGPLRQPARGLRKGEMGFEARATGEAQCAPAVGPLDDGGHPASELVGSVRRHEIAGHVVVDELRQAPDPRDHAWNRHCHRLEDRIREALHGEGRERDEVGSGQDGGHVGAISEEANRSRDAQLDSQGLELGSPRPVSDDERVRIRPPGQNLREGPQEHRGDPSPRAAPRRSRRRARSAEWPSSERTAAPACGCARRS